jgi:hypothetical protein
MDWKKIIISSLKIIFGISILIGIVYLYSRHRIETESDDANVNIQMLANNLESEQEMKVNEMNLVE